MAFAKHYFQANLEMTVGRFNVDPWPGWFSGNYSKTADGKCSKKRLRIEYFATDVSSNQCDQMARVFVQFWPFTEMKIGPITCLGQNRLNIVHK